MPVLKKKYMLLLCIVSAILMSAAWPMRGFPFLVFIAFIPLLIVLDQIVRNPDRFRWMASFRFSYIAFFFWNLLTTYWIWNSTEVGAIFAIVVNSLVMALFVQIASFINQYALKKNSGGLTILAVVWLAFEHLHQHWDLSWPWLNVGNVFAQRPAWVQWYEFTGVAGGTAWVWIINILLFRLLMFILDKKSEQSKMRRNLIILVTVVFVLPSVWSIHRYYNYEEKPNPIDIVLVQPNLNPYTEEYSLSTPEVLDRLLTPTAAFADKKVDFIVAPESVLQDGMFEDEFQYSQSIAALKKFLKDYSPQASFISGAGTLRMLDPDEPLGPSARRYNSKMYYEAFNTALFIDSTGIPLTYHKSRLVPGVEQMPFVHVIKPIEKLAIDLGGTVGTLGKSSDRTVYKGGKVPISAVICYESVYGEFVSDFVKNGAEVILILTNDGWWKDTPGHRQHFAYAPLRAIETRRPIARAANTGISCFINQRGDVVQKTEYWTRDVIRNTVNANDEITFYVRYGDYIGRGMSFAMVLLLVIAIMQYFVYRINRRKTHLS
ncbi:MAG: apolipoprotein N-acyltransferase [Bacteroidetes bacterium HGW-Bacteroidetes-6]|jgi:apolipoprotein N-acyltransferase|nr:MAG: apolipoprotein N-acyltransferase [Bacteroidetes bacterium HGW-Bacteroidetes-6]